MFGNKTAEYQTSPVLTRLVWSGTHRTSPAMDNFEAKQHKYSNLDNKI
jgi:hypothetical protein